MASHANTGYLHELLFVFPPLIFCLFSLYLRLSVDCPHCEGGMVNSNDLLTLEAMCPDCDNGTIYEWSLYIVRDGKTGPSPSGKVQ